MTATSPAIAQDALTPSSAWVIDAQEDDCVLMRNYSTATGKNDVQLLIRPQVNADSLDLTILTPMRGKPPRKSALTTVLTPGGDVQVPGAFQAEVAGGRAVFFRYNPEATALFRKAESIEVRDGVQRVMLLKVSGVEKAIAGAKTCMDGLVQAWGYDPVEMRALSRRATPIGNPSKWAGLDSYPLEAMRAGEPVSVDVRIDVNANGRATKCAVWRGDKRVDERQVCGRMVRLGKYEPALDSEGKAVPAFWIGRLEWFVP